MKLNKLLLLMVLLVTSATGAWAQSTTTTTESYTVKMKEVTKDAEHWTISPPEASTTGVAEGKAVTLNYTGRLKVKSVTATHDGPDPLTVPLTMEVIEAGSIKVKIGNGSGTLTTGMKYSVNGGQKQTIYQTTTIDNLSKGDKVQFYGNEDKTQAYGNSPIVIISDGTAKVKVYGNIMSLLDENNFTNLTTLPNIKWVFAGLFYGNAKLTDASGLLLPAKTLAESCYSSMFYGCSSLTAAPALPAETLTKDCYVSMFNGCSELTSGPVLPARTLAGGCYAAIFSGCSKLASVTCLATTISDNGCLDSWLDGTDSSITRTLYVDDSMTGVSKRDWNINNNWTIKPVSEKP